MSERIASNLHKYFGQDSPFAAACDLVEHSALPEKILAYAATLGKSSTAYRLGYAFAAVLQLRTMRITRDDLTQIGWIKITYGEPAEFENGFRAYQAENKA